MRISDWSSDVCSSDLSSTAPACCEGGPDAMTPLLKIDDLRIEGQSEGDSWFEIVKGVSLTLNRGEVLGLIGESGAGQSTIGLASMGYARSGCRIPGGSIKLNEQEREIGRAAGRER